MLNTLKIYDDLTETMDERAARKIAYIIGMVYEELQNVVTKVEFKELTDNVKELSKAQRQTELRIQELAEAQKALAEAQKRTEKEIHQLVVEHKDTRKQLGGISTTVGYGIEDKAYPALPALLKQDFGITVQERLIRDYVKDRTGRNVEVNILGRALNKDGKNITIIGEGKSQLSVNDVNDFIRKKLNRLQDVFDEIFPVMVTYMVSAPEVRDYLREKGIALYYSYNF
ncbi:MAG: hypothetical protein BWK80_05400 [Desulfobacteraceae bacterium IS3]|nr:MAG: hypothetical protein BWK80_05400 [Desulfobacteraceae bacterium IS3]